MQFAIKTPIGFVAKFNKQFQIVQVCTVPSYAKMFKSKEKAMEFIDLYADTGYGMMADAVKVITLKEAFAE